MTWRFTKPLLRTHAPHCGQRGHDVGRRARSTSTASTRRMARTRANDHAARISAVSVWASSTVQSKRCTQGSSSRMLSLRHSIGHRSPFGTRSGGSKSVPYVCCYASPPPTVNYARRICSGSALLTSLLKFSACAGHASRVAPGGATATLTPPPYSEPTQFVPDRLSPLFGVF